MHMHVQPPSAKPQSLKYSTYREKCKQQKITKVIFDKKYAFYNICIFIIRATMFKA